MIIPTYVLLICLVVWNVLTFAIYGIDKRKAKMNAYRTSEKALISAAFLMAGVGALFGMVIFRHKTKHIKFRVLVPLAIVFNMFVIACYWFFLCGSPF